MKHVTPNTEPRYGIIEACVLSLVKPVTTVRRADHLPVLKAWSVHLIGCVMVLIVSLFLIAWDENSYGPGSAYSFAGALMDVVNATLRELRNPAGLAVFIMSVLFIEVGWWVSALITMPWSARDEPFRQSHRRALRRLYLLTPHLATIVAVTGFGVILLNNNHLIYDLLYNYWYHIDDAIDMLAMVLVSLWILRVVLGGLDCDPRFAYCLWPARCTLCGYQLTGLRKDQDCPECGTAVITTLDPLNRPGTGSHKYLAGWFGQTWWAIRKPRRLGEVIHVLSPDPNYKRVLTVTIAALMLVSIPAMSMVYVSVELAQLMSGYRYETFDWDQFIFVTFFVGPWVGVLITGAMMTALLIGSVLAGVIEGWRQGRNLMPAAVRAASYLSGFTVLWAVVFWCDLCLCIVTIELDLLTPIVMKYNIAREELILTWQGGVILLGVMIYLIQIGKATRAARYANW